MKTSIFTSILVFMVAFIMFSCSSDDDKEKKANESVTIAGKHLKKIEMEDRWGSSIADFFYNTSGQLVNIRYRMDDDSDSDYEDFTFEWDDDILRWGGNYAILENGRAKSTTMKDCLFKYDENGRIVEMKCGSSNLVVTWTGDNITCWKDGWEQIEYTYTNHLAGMVAYEFCFNPFSENDYLDMMDERVYFYTGICGPLSKNLPATAVFKDTKGKEIGNRTYTYEFNKGLVESVLIDGYTGGYGYPIKMKFTWE